MGETLRAALNTLTATAPEWLRAVALPEWRRGRKPALRPADRGEPAAGTEPLTVSQMWHPRLDADPAHRWLRGVVRAACRVPGRA